MKRKYFINQFFDVPFNYNVFFTENLFDINNFTFLNLFKNSEISNIIMIFDEKFLKYHIYLSDKILNYFEFYSDFIKLKIFPVIFSGGEKSKNSLTDIQLIYKLVNEYKLCRQSYIVVLGGGSLIDAVGYAASSAHRGIRLIRIPTTVLSQNDSGVGVKSGINYFGKKNFLGNFNPPYSVLNDSDFLITLPDNLWKSGISECIKVALIKDINFFWFIRENYKFIIFRNIYIMNAIVYRCAKLHVRHIGNFGDPFEFGSARPLDFGHWAAHKLESLTKSLLLHGDAVAIGIAIDCVYSYLSGFLSRIELEYIIDLLDYLGFNLYIREMQFGINCLNNDNENYNSILSGLEEFKEHLGGNLTLMFLKKIGVGFNVNFVNIVLLKKSINILKNFSLIGFLLI